MDLCDGHSIAPYIIGHTPNSAFGTESPLPDSQRQNKKKRTREAAAQDGQTASRESRKKKKRRSNDTVLPVSSVGSSANSAPGTLVKKEKKKEKKSKKQKSSAVPSGYEDHEVADHGLDFTSMINGTATASDSTVGNLYLQPSDHEPALPIDGEDGQTASEKRRKKKKGSSNDTILPVESSVGSSANSAPGTVVKEQRKKEKKSKKQKSSVLPSSYEDHGVAGPELDFTSMINDSAAAADSTVGNLYLQPSNHEPVPLLNSNDDILHAFQSLDFSSLAGVLRGVELPSAGVDINTGDNPLAELLDPNYLLDNSIAGDRVPPVSASSARPRKTKRVSEPSTVAKQRSKPSSKSITPKTNPNLPAVGPSIANAEHTEMLATKWLTSEKLNELVETEGLVYKKGKFSAIEHQALKTAVENYRVTCGLSHEQMLEVIYSKRRVEHGKFWTEITASVPARPIIAVYHYIHRAYDPLRLQGKWTAEEDAALVSAVGDLGQAWQKVKDRVGRSAPDCRDRWRNHLVDRSERQRGTWSKAEEEELTRIVQELTTEQGKSADNDVFWTIISQRMGNKRGRQQCRIKWTDSLNTTVKNGGEKPRWRKHDTYILVHKVASMGVRDDSEIDWKLLSDDDWNLWSAHTMQRQWRQLKQTIKGHEEMGFQEVTEILKQKCTVQPEVLGNAGHDVTRKAGKRPPKSPKKVKSAAVIDDKWDDERWESED